MSETKNDSKEPKSGSHEAYQDGAKGFLQDLGKEIAPLGKTIGKGTKIFVEDVCSILGDSYGIIKGAVSHFKKRLYERLASEDPEELVTPQLAIAAPLIDHYKYLGEEEELQEMFVNLSA